VSKEPLWVADWNPTQMPDTCWHGPLEPNRQMQLVADATVVGAVNVDDVGWGNRYLHT